MNYQHELKLLQYDMLYGDKVSYGWVNPFESTDMKFGISPPIISSISRSEDTLYITGGDFNKWSKVFINGEKVSSSLLDQNTLLVMDVETKEGDIVTIQQVGKGSTYYNESPGYMLQ